MTFAKFVISLFHFLRHLLFVQRLVFEVHIPHVMLAGIMAYLQFGIQAFQFLQRVFHGENATNHGRTLCVDVGLAFEYLGETFVHPTCNALMLFRAKQSQLTVSKVCVVANGLHPFQYLLSVGGQLTQRVCTHQWLVSIVVVTVVNQMPTSVSSVMTDIIGYISLRGLGQL